MIASTVKCKHLNGRKTFFLGRQSNGNQIMWCAECGAAKFAKGVLGPRGPSAKWYRPRPPKAAT